MFPWVLIAIGVAALYAKHISSHTSTRVLLIAVALVCFLIGGAMIVGGPALPGVPSLAQ